MSGILGKEARPATSEEVSEHHIDRNRILELLGQEYVDYATGLIPLLNASELLVIPVEEDTDMSDLVKATQKLTYAVELLTARKIDSGYETEGPEKHIFLGWSTPLLEG